MIGDLTAAAACGGTVLLAEPLTVAGLRRWCVLDVPVHRSSHTVPTPRGGGLPIAAGLLLTAALAHNGASAAFAAAVTLLGALGLADDMRTLPASTRLILQAAGSAVSAGLLMTVMHRPVAEEVGLAVVVAVWITGFVNVFNFMDGVNGISAAHALIAGAAYACYGIWAQRPFLSVASMAVAAGALLFLPWNVGRAWVFLGDVGSYALGAALAVLAAAAVLHGVPAEAILGPLAVYLADTGWTLQRRIRAREPWLQSHRTHVYQQWCDAGWSHQEVTLLTGALSILLTLLGAASLTGDLPLRAAADLAGLALLAGYLRSPTFFRRIGWAHAVPQPCQSASAMSWVPELEGRPG